MLLEDAILPIHPRVLSRSQSPLGRAGNRRLHPVHRSHSMLQLHAVVRRGYMQCLRRFVSWIRGQNVDRMSMGRMVHS